MSNDFRNGLQITPLVMAICSALWLVLFSLMAWNLHETVQMGRALSGVPTMQKELDDHEDRLRKLETRK